MRPKLRDDCTYVEVDDGVYLETATGAAHITGRSAYALVDRLAAHLTGERTIDELTEGLPEAHRRAVTDLVTQLLHRKLARDVDTDPPHTLSAEELSRYRDEIAFAEHVGNAPVSRFEAFRTSRVLLVGAGATMAALMQSLYKLGLRAPALLRTAEVAGEDPDTYQRVLQRCRADDPLLDLTVVDEPQRWDDAAGVRALVDGYDAVLHASDRCMPSRARALTRAGRAAAVPVLHSLPLTGDAWLGPTGVDACAECLWWNLRSAAVEGSRLRAVLEADDPVRVEPYLSAPLASLLGAKLSFAYFRHALGAQDDTSLVTRVALDTTLTSEHAVTPHARCPMCGTAASATPTDGTSTDPEGFSAAVAGLVDERLGPILRLDTGDHAQLPLNTVDASITDPLAAGKEPQVVTTVGNTRSEALRRAATVALETIAAAVDPDADARADAAVRVAVAGGLTWPEAQVRAILRLHHTLARVVAPPAPQTGADTGDGWLAPSVWPAAARPLAENAAILGTPLYAWRADAEPPTVFVGGGGTWLARSCSVDAHSALTAAAQAALAQLAGQPCPPGCDVGVEPGAAVDWDGCLTRLLDEAAADGLRIVVRRLDGGPAVRAALPFVAVASAVSA
ncbi:hypothetical protein ACWD6L_27200 [Micromonospora profundi]